MRLPNLNRKGKILRNLLLAAVLLFLIWYANDFRSLSLEQAADWRGRTYYLDDVEVLGRFETTDDGFEDVLLRSGDRFFSTTAKRNLLGFWRISELQAGEPLDDRVMLIQRKDVFPKENMALYLWADLPEAARAECRLRLQEQINVRITVEETQVADEHFDWDETYTMEAQPTEAGVWRFDLRRKYPDDYTADYPAQAKASAEESTWRSFQNMARRVGGTDFRCTMQVTFFDDAGNEVRTCEKILWDQGLVS